MTSRPSGSDLLDALESGEVRAAQPEGDAWQVNAWVKEGLLEIFRASDIVPQAFAGGGPVFRDKAAFPPREFAEADGVRLVPGGSAVRRGAYVGPGVVIMPPAYVNVGAYVGARSLIDSHALVGSCAQIGQGVHVSAAAQIGGVLEPVTALPVIVEDGAFVGGGCGMYEGVRIGARAVIAAGVVLTGSTVVYDLVHESTLPAPLVIPAGAVVVPGTRPVRGDWGRRLGLAVACASIVKYRDEKTDAATALEQALR